MNNQEIIEYTFEKLWQQNCVSYGNLVTDGKPVCLLRGPNNTKCAVGWLIPDYLYYKGLETKSLADLTEMAIPDINPENRVFLQHLQAAHDICAQFDKSAFRKELKISYQKLCNKFNNLNPKFLESYVE